MADHDLDFLPSEIREGLARARKTGRPGGTGLRVQVGEARYPILSIDGSGFEVALGDGPRLRGHVEIRDGTRMIHSALIVAGAPDGDLMRYEFKRLTSARTHPPLDYAEPGEGPGGPLPAV
jgi:hypothetical protein